MSPSPPERIVAAALLALLPLCACSSEDSTPKDSTDGAVIYAQALCASCHGSAGKGSFLGPELARLDEHWTRDTLADFIRDPESVVDGDPRLAELSKKYPTRMAPQKTLTKAQRLSIADWLLARD